MKKQLIEEVAKRLSTEMNKPEIIQKFGKLSYIARFRNQFNNPDETIPTPAIAIEVAQTNFRNRSKGQQEMSATIRIHVHFRNLEKQLLKKDLMPGMEELEYQELIHEAIHAWKPTGFTSLTRVEQSEDLAYDFALTDVIGYSVTAIDACAYQRRNHVESDASLQVNGDEFQRPEKTSPYPFET